jgi:hypothetical protein
MMQLQQSMQQLQSRGVLPPMGGMPMMPGEIQPAACLATLLPSFLPTYLLSLLSFFFLSFFLYIFPPFFHAFVVFVLTLRLGFPPASTPAAANPGGLDFNSLFAAMNQPNSASTLPQQPMPSPAERYITVAVLSPENSFI